jgi:hypothetical protein
MGFWVLNHGYISRIYEEVTRSRLERIAPLKTNKKNQSRQFSRPARLMCKNQELHTIVSEQSDQALSWCKSQVHMFEGDLIGFDKLGAHHEAHRI